MKEIDQLIPKLFRTEYSKLVAVLCKVFGLSNIQVAEDIVSDTFVLAAEKWKEQGLPDNQVAWLYTVAKNRARDYLRREKLRREKIEPNIKHSQETSYDLELDLSEQNIEDSQLQMLFAVANPLISEQSQIAMALRVLCGFSIDEVASALLSNREVINKRLYRAKQNLRKHKVKLELPPPKHIAERLDTVLTSLYLLFNEGYYATHSDVVIRKDLCREAMRLCILLTRNESTDLPKVSALLSLMCFHSSRFEARFDAQGDQVLYYEQDRNLWQQSLIAKGEYYLNRSSTGEQLDKFHLEAAIAYWHTEEDSHEKWENILQLYNYLLQLEYSPIAALNRTYALARADGANIAIPEALKLNLEDRHLYHTLLAQLYAEINNLDKQKLHLNLALDKAASKRDRDFIQAKLDKLS